MQPASLSLVQRTKQKTTSSMVSGGSTVVELSTYHPKVKGSSPASDTSSGTDNMAKKLHQAWQVVVAQG